jgi:hypothetical protein
MPKVSRWRRRLLAGGSAFALTSAMAAALATPAAAQAPTATVTCTTDGSTNAVFGSFSDLPPSESFILFALLELSNGTTTTYQGVLVNSDGTGAAQTPSVAVGLPLGVHIALYRDGNGNARWDPSIDDTVFRGDATVSTCPSLVAVAPK